MQLTAWIGFRDQLPRQAPRAAFCPHPTCYPNFARRPLSGEPVQPAESSWEASLTHKASPAKFPLRQLAFLSNQPNPERVPRGQSWPLPTEIYALSPPRQHPSSPPRHPEMGLLRRYPSQGNFPLGQAGNHFVKPRSYPLCRSNSREVPKSCPKAGENATRQKFPIPDRS